MEDLLFGNQGSEPVHGDEIQPIHPELGWILGEKERKFFFVEKRVFGGNFLNGRRLMKQRKDREGIGDGPHNVNVMEVATHMILLGNQRKGKRIYPPSNPQSPTDPPSLSFHLPNNSHS